MAGNLMEVTDSTFEAEVIKSPIPVVVDFWAPWCAPCKAMTPVLEAYAEAKGGSVKVVKINVQDHTEVATQLGVLNIPKFIVFSGGKPVGELTGFTNKDKFFASVDKMLAG